MVRRMSSIIDFVPLGDRPLHEIVAAVIRGEMAKLQISQAKAAAVLGIAQQSLNRKVRGVTPFTLDELDALAGTIRMPAYRVLQAAYELAETQDASASGLGESGMVRHQGLEPRTRWFGAAEIYDISDYLGKRAVDRGINLLAGAL